LQYPAHCGRRYPSRGGYFSPLSQAAAHFATRFAFDTDCRDVPEVPTSRDPGLVLLGVCGSVLLASGHTAGAINLPHHEFRTGRRPTGPECKSFLHVSEIGANLPLLLC